jgi:hypothetical protein
MLQELSRRHAAALAYHSPVLLEAGLGRCTPTSVYVVRKVRNMSCPIRSIARVNALPWAPLDVHRLESPLQA